jgi:phenylalanyl-tRNA synthetase beta chain
MKVTLSWLREFVPIELDTAALCERLTMAGLEVEATEEIAADIRAVVIGEIVSTAAHPAAAQLTLCQVRTGIEGAVPVVCGATNMRAGDRVAYAPAGTTLPGGRRIDAVEIRGVLSQGMLCSEAELGISAEAAGILVLPPEAPLGERVGAYLRLEDTVLEIAVTPNRGDCLSVLGIAREIAALTGKRLQRRRRLLRESGAAAAQSVEIRIDDASACARYAARLIRNVRIGPSPRWMQNRLLAVGLRPINNVVDITNYVMIDRGQPLHAFDYDRLPRPQIVVRRAGPSSRMVTLDGLTRSLREDDLLITTGEEPAAIAGVMGGATTEVRDTTTTVLLESAWFDPACVRRTARRLDLHSESSFRFERGVDVGGVPTALDRAAALMQEIAGGCVAPEIIDAYPGACLPAPIHVRVKRIEEILGLGVTGAEASGILKSLGAKVSSGPRGSLAVVPATFRSDLTREIDVIEEIGRVVGYDRIPATMPVGSTEAGLLPVRLAWVRELKRLLAAYGMHEVVSLSFASTRGNAIFPGVGVAGRPVKVANPVNQEECELRLSLLGGLVAMWKLNRGHGAGCVAGFEISKVFWRQGEFGEGWRIAGLLAAQLPQQGLGMAAAPEFADAKGVVEAVLDRLHLLNRIGWEPLRDQPSFHPGKSARIRIDATIVGILASLHPEVETELDVSGANWLFELDLERLLAYVPSRVFFRELPRFPAVVRDVAIMAEADFASDRVLRFVRERGDELVEEIVLFDQYTGAPIPAGRKSLAYSISYRAADRTLTDEEVNRVHGELTAALSRALPVELR